MANVLRDAMPLLHAALGKYLSDQIEYKRGTADYVVTAATPAPSQGEEPMKGGNVLRLFMSQIQVGATPPARGDLLRSGGVEYVVNNVESDDYDGYFLIAIKK